MFKGDEALRTEVKSFVVSEVERLGPHGFERKAVVERFTGQASRSTLFRWISETIGTGVPARRAIESIAGRKAKPAEPISVGNIEAVLPQATAALEAITAVPGSNTTLAIVDKLRDCLNAAEQVMAHARDKTGAVRNSKLLLQATEAQRRCLETALRISVELRELQATDQFHAAVIAEFKKLAPDIGARLAIKLQELTSVWTMNRA